MRASVALAAVVAVAASALGAGSAGAARSVRGFDGTTIKVASMGVLSQFPGDPAGVQARIKRFNDTNEIKGVKLEFTEAVDDKFDPTNALSEARRLVTQEEVFAMVGDISIVGVGEYYNQQHVPNFGAGYNVGYCSKGAKPDPSIYSFGLAGCVAPPAATQVADVYKNSYTYAAQKAGKKHPTLAIFGDDSNTSIVAQNNAVASATGAGFDVVYHGPAIPGQTVSDFTPTAQTLLHSKHGDAPDAMLCLVGAQCINVFMAVQANGYQGAYLSVLYSDLLVKALAGTAVYTYYNNLAESTPGVDQLKHDVQAYKADAAVDGGTLVGYVSTDMFIQALKTVAKKGKSNITPEAVQKAAMHQTWQIKGLAGPVEYPASTVRSTPACTAVSESDGTAWKVVAPFSCSSTTYPVKKK